MKRRRTYPKEFKEEAIRLVEEEWKLRYALCSMHRAI